jgi:hypothetical protein
VCHQRADAEHGENRAGQVAEQAAGHREQRLLGEYRAAYLASGGTERAQQGEPVPPQVDRERGCGGQREQRGDDEQRDHHVAEGMAVGDLHREREVGQAGAGAAGRDRVPGAAVQGSLDVLRERVGADARIGPDRDQVHQPGSDDAAGEPGFADGGGGPRHAGQRVRELGGHASVGLQRRALCRG